MSTTEFDGIQALDFNEYALDDIPNETTENQQDSARSSVAPEHAPVTQMEEDIGIQDLGVDNVVKQTSIRKPRPKLDADKLLNPRRGYPALLKSLRKVKYRGPGDEKKYLRKYVMTYQIWANRLWPKANFDDFIMLARRAGKDPQVRQYCRDLIESEKYGSMDFQLPADAANIDEFTTNTDPAAAPPPPEVTASPSPPLPQLDSRHGTFSPDPHEGAQTSSNSAEVEADLSRGGENAYNGPDDEELEAMYGELGF